MWGGSPFGIELEGVQEHRDHLLEARDAATTPLPADAAGTAEAGVPRQRKRQRVQLASEEEAAAYAAAHPDPLRAMVVHNEDNADVTHVKYIAPRFIFLFDDGVKCQGDKVFRKEFFKSWLDEQAMIESPEWVGVDTTPLDGMKFIKFEDHTFYTSKDKRTWREVAKSLVRAEVAEDYVKQTVTKSPTPVRFELRIGAVVFGAMHPTGAGIILRYNHRREAALRGGLRRLGHGGLWRL